MTIKISSMAFANEAYASSMDMVPPCRFDNSDYATAEVMMGKMLSDFLVRDHEVREVHVQKDIHPEIMK